MNHNIPTSIKIAALVTLALATLIGCDDRAARIAERAADRQAEQNRELVRLNREVAAGTSQLVTVDAQARQQALEVHQELQQERAGLAAGWSDLETERQRIAQSRRTDSALAALVSGGAATMAALMALALAWATLSRRGSADGLADAEYNLVLESIVDIGSRGPPLPTPPDSAIAQRLPSPGRREPDGTPP